MKKLYVWLYIVKKLILKEFKTGKNIPCNTEVWSWSKGFFSSSYVLYGLDGNDPEEYLSDYQENVKAIRLNDGYSEILDDKVKFTEVIKGFLKTPNDIAVILNGRIIDLESNGNNLKISDIVKILKDESCLILKPRYSAAGEGVLKIQWGEQGLTCNSAKISEVDFEDILKKLDDYLITPCIKQAKYSNEIYPNTLNTIRILTMASPSGKPFISAAAHRFGTNKSFPVDNCNAGGITAFIDTHTGILGSAVFTYFDGIKLIKMDTHPDTGNPIKGVLIPGWNNVVEELLTTAEKLSYLKYIGWDVVIRDKDFIILEGNNGPDIKLHQVHRPLLIDEETRDFFKYYNVIN